MSEMRRCKQCGILKAADAFRPYSYTKKEDSEATGRFRICRQCESINTIYKRLCKERDDKFWDPVHQCYSYATYANGAALYSKLTSEIEKIEALYYALEKHGYSVPTRYKQSADIKTELPSKTVAYADKLLEFYGASEPAPQQSSAPAPQPTNSNNVQIALEPDEIELPDDLSYWLNQSMDDFRNSGFTPDYLQETVYESLKAKYRPQVGTDPSTFLPIYDDTYKSALNLILRKFDAFEDFCIEEDTNGEDT